MRNFPKNHFAFWCRQSLILVKNFHQILFVYENSITSNFGTTRVKVETLFLVFFLPNVSKSLNFKTNFYTCNQNENKTQVCYAHFPF